MNSPAASTKSSGISTVAIILGIIVGFVVFFSFWLIPQFSNSDDHGVTVSGLTPHATQIAEKQLRVSAQALKKPRYSDEQTDATKGSAALTAALDVQGLALAVQQVSCLRQDDEGKRVCLVTVGAAGSYNSALVQVQSNDALVGPFVVYGGAKWPWRISVPHCFARFRGEEDCPRVDHTVLIDMREGYSHTNAVMASFDLGALSRQEAQDSFLRTLELVLVESDRVGGKPFSIEKKRTANRMTYNSLVY